MKTAPNIEQINRYIENQKNTAPPKIEVEVYFFDTQDKDLVTLKGNNNSTRTDSLGVSLVIEFNEEYTQEFAKYQDQVLTLQNFPMEYYKVVWRTFAGESLTFRSKPINCSLIDINTAKHHLASNRWMINSLSLEEKVQLSLAYRQMRSDFTSIEHSLNQHLVGTTHSVKQLSLGLDVMTKWEQGVSPYLDKIPFHLIGQGEQSCTRIKLAMSLAEKADVFLIEEPENHLSHAKLNQLISGIAKGSNNKQVILTTHSSFVLNKLGLGNLILFNGGLPAKLTDLSPDTLNYFKCLPNFDTLRLILADKSILVEGPSDVLIVQKAYQLLNNKLPLDDGIDIISIGGLSFKRFLDIAKLLPQIKVNVR